MNPPIWMIVIKKLKKKKRWNYTIFIHGLKTLVIKNGGETKVQHLINGLFNKSIFIFESETA